MAKARAAANAVNEEAAEQVNEVAEQPTAAASVDVPPPPEGQDQPAGTNAPPSGGETAAPDENATLVSRQEGENLPAGETDQPLDSNQTPTPETIKAQVVTIGSSAMMAAYRGENGAFGVYDIDKRAVRRQFFSSGFSPTSVAIDEQQGQVVLGGDDGSIRMFSTDSFDGVDQFKRERILRDEQKQSLIAHENPVSAVAIRSRDGVILTGDTKGQIRLWSGHRQEPLELPGSSSSAVDLQVQGESNSVLAVTAGQQVLVWKTDPDLDSVDPPRVFASLEGVPTVMRTGTGGRGLVVGDEEGNVSAWTAVEGSLKEQRVRAHRSAIVQAALIGKGESLITASRGGEVAQWSLPLPTATVFRTAESSPVLTSDASGRWVASRSGGGRNLDVYHASTGKPFRRYSLDAGQSADAQIVSAAFSSDGSWLLAGDSSGRAHLFRTSDTGTFGHVRIGEGAIKQLMVGGEGEGSTTFGFLVGQRRMGVLGLPETTDTAQETPSPSLVGAYDICKIFQDGKMLAGVRATQVHLVDMQAQKRLAMTSIAPLADDETTAISVSGEHVLLGTKGGKVALWKVGLDSPTPIDIISSGVHQAPILAVGTDEQGHVWSCDGNGQVVTTPLRRVNIDAANNDIAKKEDAGTDGNLDAKTVPPFAAGSSLHSAVISGTRLLATTKQSAVLFDADGTQRGLKELPDDATLTVATLSDNGVLAAFCDSQRRLWSFGPSHAPEPIEMPEIGRIQDIRISTDNRMVVLVGVSDTQSQLVTVDLESMTVVAVMREPSIVQAINHFDGSSVYVSDPQERVRRLEVPNVRWSKEADEEILDGDYNAAAQLFLSVGASGRLMHYDSTSGKLVAEVDLGEKLATEVACLYGTSNSVVLTSDGALGVYEAGQNSGQWRPEVAKVPTGVHHLTCGPDGQQVFALRDSGGVVNWPADGLGAPHFEVPLDFRPERFSISGVDRVIASSKDDANLRILSTQSSRRMILAGSSSMEDMVVFPDQSNFAVVDGSSTVGLFNLEGEQHNELIADDVGLDRLAVHPRGIRLVALGVSKSGQTKKRQLAIWDLANLEKIVQIELPKFASRIVHSADGNRIALAMDDNTIEVRDSATGQLIEAFETQGTITSLRFTADSEKLIFGRDGGDVVIQSLASLGSIDAHDGPVRAAVFAADRIVTCSDDGLLKVWDFQASDEPLVSLQGPADGRPLDLDVSADGDRLVAVFNDPKHQTCVWDLGSAIDLGGSVAPGAVMLSEVENAAGGIVPDGTKVLVAGTNGVIHAWSVAEARPIARFEGPQVTIADLSISADGQQIVAAGVDRNVQTWQFPVEIASSGDKVPLGALAATSMLNEPQVAPADQIAANEDPLDEIRQLLIEGTESSEDGAIFDFFPGDSTTRGKVKRELDVLRQMEEKVKLLGSATVEQLAAISRAKSGFFDSRRDLTGDQGENTQLSFSSGHKNLVFAAETDYNFKERGFRPVKLTIASDRYVYAARKGVAVDKNGGGSMSAWDFGYSGVKTHSWSSVGLNVQEIYASPDGRGAFTVPDLFVFGHDGYSKSIASGARWAVSPSDLYSNDFLFAVGTRGSIRSEEVIFKIYDGGDLLSDAVQSLSKFSAYEGVVTAMAFAKQHRQIAFCVRERSTHRLYLADPSNMDSSSFELLDERPYTQPMIVETDEQGNPVGEPGPPGITTLEFSPDDKLLIAVGNYGQEVRQVSMWGLDWNAERSSSRGKSGVKIRQVYEPWNAEEGNAIVEHGSRSVRFIEPKPRKESSEGIPRMGSSSASSGDLVVFEKPGGLRIMNLRSRKVIRDIPFVATQWGRPEYYITEDGRWVIMGDDNGTINIFDLIDGKQTSLTVDGRPAHAGPVVGVTLSEPDPVLGFPAYAATVGEENQLKVWDLILPFTSREATTYLPNPLLKR